MSVRSKSHLLLRVTSLVALLVLMPSPFHGQTKDNSRREYALKAVYLERFTRFITWPAASQIETDGVFQLCTYQGNPFGGALKAAFQGVKVQGSPVRLYQVFDAQALANCHMVFIASSEHSRLYEVFPATFGKPILTVSDNPGFAERGVSINFFIKDDKLRFEINETALQNSGLKVSYHLLKAAKIIQSKGKR